MQTKTANALSAGRMILRNAHRTDETACVENLLSTLSLNAASRRRIEAQAAEYVVGMRNRRRHFGGLDDFLAEYSLSTKEGVALMCIAEALLRVPDPETANSLISDKIGTADWEAHFGKSDSLFVNASTWALMLTGEVARADSTGFEQPPTLFKRLVTRLGEPVIRAAMEQAMRVMGRQFVMGRTMDEALTRAQSDEGYLHSFDVLGEAARTASDAERYYDAYLDSARAVGKAALTNHPAENPSISVKLSALHPRYEYAQRARALPIIIDRVRQIAFLCRDHHIGLTIDAEEADRLDISLDVIAALAGEPQLSDWDGFGLAVQAYQKRALPLIDWLAELSNKTARRLAVRLVKGAYWDTEIKHAQERGYDGYPVFTRKASTDLSYLVCAERLLDLRERFYPQFATHNAHTVAAVLEMAGADGGFEFQRLHGMGEPLYDQLVRSDDAPPCRVYAPVGSHEDLLPYLVRRLLENGANSSFVHRLRDDEMPLDEIVADPADNVRALTVKPHPKIVLPADLFAPDRDNSSGLDLDDQQIVKPLLADLARAADGQWQTMPLVEGKKLDIGTARQVRDPADHDRVAGTVTEATPDSVALAMIAATRAFDDWDSRSALERASVLERIADLYQRDRTLLMAMAVREAGKTIPDALAEVREAIDFCRYYALRLRKDFSEPLILPGPTGERNSLSLHGRGVFACISPWNFPLAIFAGQIAAALAAGNSVVAKPAEQTPLIAGHAVRLMHEAGVPPGALNLLPGGGDIGAALVGDPRIAGVAFTGSTAVARAINRSLAAKDGPIVPLIAETGGQNALIADATALPEQLVDDVIASGFRSAGQRCSALRVLFVQDEIADRVFEMLDGAARELVVGDPMDLSTDVGPIIDAGARSRLIAHVDRMSREGQPIAEALLGSADKRGIFFAPRAYEIDDLDRLDGEIFGPIIHAIRFAGHRLDAVTEAINASGYGLTVGVHSRIDSVQDYVAHNVRAGNAYINRNIIGAVVGSQPFGGEGLSGTGPKAGGPHYIYRFSTERSLSVNTAAAGGNTALATLER